MTTHLRDDLRAPSTATPPTATSAVLPVLPGFYPDPTVCRVGEEYYLANSSFEYRPGVPLHRSTDLVRWEPAGHALTRDDQFAGTERASGGIYAPTLRHHDGRFWLITTDVTGRAGQLLVSAPELTGPWSPARIIEGLDGIDPDLAWDEDGTCYVTYCSSDPELGGIAQARVDLSAGVALEAPRPLWPGTGLAHPEGPHLYRRGAWWYLLIAEGGTERGHAVSVARATSPEGPFESHPQNPLLSHRSTTHPVQNTGHADLVEMVDGSWAMVFLGVRARGTTPMFHVNGRETFVVGVEWVDDWPRLDVDRFASSPSDTAFVDDFSAWPLASRWISAAASPDAFCAPAEGRGVVLTAPPTNPLDAPLLSVRARDERWEFTVDVDAAESVALRVRMDDRHWYELRLDAGRAGVVLNAGPVSTHLPEVSAPHVGGVALSVSAVDPTTHGPDDLEFAIIDDRGRRVVGRADGRYLSTEVAGGFTGRTVGVRALTGVAHVASARYAPGR